MFAIGAQLADSHPSSSDTPLTMLSNWDRADRAVIKALRAKYRAQQEAATAPEPAAAQTEPVPIVDQDPQAVADRALFQSIIDGTAPDLLSPELADQFDAAGERRADDPSMKDLFEQAVNAYQEAMLAATANISA